MLKNSFITDEVKFGCVHSAKGTIDLDDTDDEEHHHNHGEHNHHYHEHHGHQGNADDDPFQ